MVLPYAAEGDYTVKTCERNSREWLFIWNPRSSIVILWSIQSVDDMALAIIRVKPFKWYRLSWCTKRVLTFKPVDKTLVFLTVQMKVAEQFLQLCYYAVQSGSDF